jgi:hypothetical protein
MRECTQKEVPFPARSPPRPAHGWSMADNSLVPSSSPEPPIFHVDGWDVRSYESLEAAGSDLESYDVGVGAWYARNGRVLQATAPNGRGPERIVVVDPAATEFLPDSLAGPLRKHLQSVAINRAVIAQQIGLTTGWANVAPLTEFADMSVRFDTAWRNRPRLARRLWKRVTSRGSD